VWEAKKRILGDIGESDGGKAAAAILFKEEKDGECLRQSAPGRRQKKKNSGRRL
jgi:hypothetical protein